MTLECQTVVRERTPGVARKAADAPALPFQTPAPETRADAAEDFNSAPLTKLIGYMIDRHHVYARRQAAAIGVLLADLRTQHEPAHAEPARLRPLFKALCQELLFHMEKEEVSLFPRIIRAEAAARRHERQTPPFSDSMRGTIRMLMREHDTLCAMLDEIRAATDDYTPIEPACDACRKLYRALRDLELDLLQLICLQDRVIFPRALLTEQEIQHQ
jgi:iron-sulfur cluster repair di-iron protein